MQAEKGGVAECGSACARARIQLAQFQNQYAATAIGRGVNIWGFGIFIALFPSFCCFLRFYHNVGYYFFPTHCCSVLSLLHRAQGKIR